ncbi:MAG: energy transducer TonB [Pseudomonas sp.]|uniref:energy transducer TonB n=1 Tax=Pseudomonas sp. TaxID=306 RepID=UPI0033987C82
MRRLPLFLLLSLALHAASSQLLRLPSSSAGIASPGPEPMQVSLVSWAPLQAPATASKPAAAVEHAQAVASPPASAAPTAAVRPVAVARPARRQPVATAAAAPARPAPVAAAGAAPIRARAAAAPAPSVTSPAPPPPAEKFSQAPAFLAPPLQPRYPAQARRRNQRGTVVLEVRLDEQGRQRALQVLRSSGVASLDQAALQAVAAWRFRPETDAGRSVPSRVHIPIEFALTASR